MKKLYEKNALDHALVWIGIYVVGTMLADMVSESVGVTKLVTLIVTAAMSAYLLVWLRREGLMERFGLCNVQGGGKVHLWFLPLALLASVNLWNGVQWNLTIHESVFYAVSMMFVGFLEEIIFRGFLFRALEKDGFLRAVAIASVTFGIGHIVNLLSGAELIPTLLQLVYATAAGFCFTAVFVKTRSLWPCVVCHALVNALSVFSVEDGDVFVIPIVLTAVAAGYGWWLMRGQWSRSGRS
ncbi:MAG: CPBP family intramembrane metalloprotease [Oscillospiraceae bacterium]|nr:CPBP family intramembrane metalloprotease [Oscillospiraceae bacterium]